MFTHSLGRQILWFKSKILLGARSIKLNLKVYIDQAVRAMRQARTTAAVADTPFARECSKRDFHTFDSFADIEAT